MDMDTNGGSSTNPIATVLGRDGFDIARIEKAVERLEIGYPLHYFESVSSTNSFLRDMTAERFRHGALALANHQAAGRGRFDRRWSDKPGQSLLFSLLLDVGESVERWPLLTLAAAVSVCRVLEAQGLRQAHIRWPNDVLIGERKVCGILTEKALSPRAFVLGVGLNVHQTVRDFPPSLRQSAGSLRMADRRPWNRQALLIAFLQDFVKTYELWRNDHCSTILAECRRRMSTLGRHVLLHGLGRCVEGTVMGLDDDGSLVLREPTGIVSRWHSGDVEEVRWTDINFG